MTAKINTLPIGIENSAFMLERLQTDCGPLQYLREFTQNAIEAIVKGGRAGQIIWDYDPFLFKEGLSKLCIIDTGIGMTPEEMIRYLNNLSASGSVQSLSDNYGLGAKISAAARNPFGIIYRSWKDGVGHRIYQWKDPATGQYGVKVTGSEMVTEIGDDEKPVIDGKSIIKNHGTMVTFLGRSRRENTVDYVGDIKPVSLKFKTKYLNDRYFSLPETVTIKAREYDLKHKSTRLREVHGQRKFLDQYKIDSGTVELTNATAYWWIESNEHFRAVHDYASAKGFVAALYKNEIYDFPTYEKGRIMKLQEFGITFGYRNVFILIEPHIEHLTTDTARTILKVGNNLLPWSEWAEEFRMRMPKALQAWVESQYTNTKSSDAEMQRLSRVEMLFHRTSKYVPSTDGIEGFVYSKLSPLPGPTPPEPRPGENEYEYIEIEGEPEKREPKSKDGKEPKEPKPKTEGEGQKGKGRVAWPTLRWVQPSQDEALEDRAAKFIAPMNEIHANSEFRIFKDMVGVVIEIYKASGQKFYPQAVGDKVYEWYGQFLKEVVVGIKSLGWDNEAMQKALTEEALTSAVSMKYGILQCVEKDLGKKIFSDIEKVVVDDDADLKTPEIGLPEVMI